MRQVEWQYFALSDFSNFFLQFFFPWKWMNEYKIVSFCVLNLQLKWKLTWRHRKTSFLSRPLNRNVGDNVFCFKMSQLGLITLIVESRFKTWNFRRESHIEALLTVLMLLDHLLWKGWLSTFKFSWNQLDKLAIFGDILFMQNNCSALKNSYRNPAQHKSVSLLTN